MNNNLYGSSEDEEGLIQKESQALAAIIFGCIALSAYIGSYVVS